VLEKIEQLQSGGHETMRQSKGDPAIEVFGEGWVLRSDKLDGFDGNFQQLGCFGGFRAAGHGLFGKEGRPSDQFSWADA